MPRHMTIEYLALLEFIASVSGSEGKDETYSDLSKHNKVSGLEESYRSSQAAIHHHNTAIDVHANSEDLPRSAKSILE